MCLLKQMSKQAGVQVHSTFLKNLLLSQHQKGLIALHVTNNPLRLSDRLDHPIIINNLREDGGSNKKPHLDYQLYPIISATILPPANTVIGQELLSMSSGIFTILDIQQTQIKTFSYSDSNSSYHVTNKHGRPSYRPRGRSSFNKPFLETLNYVKCCNEKVNDFFISLPMNELTLKIRADTMLGIGAMALFEREDPHLLLELIYLQSEFKKCINIQYPIFLYNNHYTTVKIPWVDKHIITLSPNQFYEIDANFVLKELLKAFPNGINLNYTVSVLPTENDGEHVSVQERIREMRPDWHEHEELTLPDENELYEKDKIKRQGYLAKINEALTKLDNKLSCMQNLENFITNKKNKLGNAEFDYYPEVNQEKLNKFIKNNMLASDEANAPLREKDLIFYSKCYNLVFRLQIYLKLLDHSKIINYKKIEEDLQWSSILHSLLEENPCLRSAIPAKERIVNDQIKIITRTYNPYFWREPETKSLPEHPLSSHSKFNDNHL